MTLAGTFDLNELLEIAVVLAIPLILIFLLVRSFRKPRAGAARDAEAASES